VACKGCLIWGQAEVLTSVELFDTIAKEFAGQNMGVRHVVKMAVEEKRLFGQETVLRND